MPLSPEQEWTLVACALVAHADAILAEGEWSRLLWMLDERLEGAEAQRWVGRLAEREALRKHLSSLPPIPPFLAEDVLHKAWRVALSDGYGSELEVHVHDDLARRLGVDEATARAWRETWTERARARAVLVAKIAAVLANIDGVVEPEERVQFEALLERLPLAPDAYDDALEGLDHPPAIDDVVAGMLALDPDERLLTLAELRPFLQLCTHRHAGQVAFGELAQRLAVGPDAVARLLDRG